MDNRPEFVLRDYQQECVDTILREFEEMNAQIVQLPTGSGKTVILWHVLAALDKKALIIAPTRELTEQIEDTGCQVVDPSQVYVKRKSYWPKDKQYLIMTGQGATFAQKGSGLDLFLPDILVIDEAHRSRSRSIETLIEHFVDKGTKVLGLTATPERLDGKSLLSVYEALTYTSTLIDLIREGYLVDLECYKIKTRHKIEEMKYSSGDIAASILRQLDVESRNEIILDVYLNRCPGTKCLVFCLNVAHSESIADQFRRKGVKAAAIYGSMPKGKRRQCIADFKSGEIQVLCNCQLLTEGFDEPSIESLILARPTKSKALYSQMIGRGVRPYPGKDKCLVYDLSDEIHNICEFNILGGMPSDFDGDWEKGQKLTKVVDRYTLSLKDVKYEYEEFSLYDRPEYDEMPAMVHQKEILDFYNAPYLDDISIDQAAYLIFKSRLLEEHGYDPRTYWKEWRENIPLCGEDKRTEARMRLIQRSLDSLHLGQVSGDAVEGAVRLQCTT